MLQRFGYSAAKKSAEDGPGKVDRVKVAQIKGFIAAKSFLQTLHEQTR